MAQQVSFPQVFGKLLRFWADYSLVIYKYLKNKML